MTMVMMTGLAITRERERGTMENLLATPATALEVMTGKVVPYILIGILQVSIVLTLAQWLFKVPMLGSYSVLSLRAAFHRRQPDAGSDDIVVRAEPATGDADDVLLLLAIAP